MYQYQIPEPLTAPINAGESIGTRRVMLNDRMLKEVPIVAIESIEEANFFIRVWDSMLMFFKGLG
ncbi:D-alanyl-D-alanine carboxypeptidase DacC precursor [compost metagenome]|nr:hypothetical protein [Pseudomonas putida]